MPILHPQGAVGAIFDFRDKAPFGQPFPHKKGFVVSPLSFGNVLGPTRETLEHRETPSGLDVCFFLLFVLQAMFANSNFNATVFHKNVFC